MDFHGASGHTTHVSLFKLMISGGSISRELKLDILRVRVSKSKHTLAETTGWYTYVPQYTFFKLYSLASLCSSCLLILHALSALGVMAHTTARKRRECFDLELYFGC